MAKKNSGHVNGLQGQGSFSQKNYVKSMRKKMSKEYHGWFIIYKTLKVKNSNGISEQLRFSPKVTLTKNQAFNDYKFKFHVLTAKIFCQCSNLERKKIKVFNDF